MVVHYDPADHKNAVLTTTDMPDAGHRTPNNLTLLLIAAMACAGFLTIGRLMLSKAEETVGPASS
jgi:hypothetical protein